MHCVFLTGLTYSKQTPVFGLVLYWKGLGFLFANFPFLLSFFLSFFLSFCSSFFLSSFFLFFLSFFLSFLLLSFLLSSCFLSCFFLSFFLSFFSFFLLSFFFLSFFLSFFLFFFFFFLLSFFLSSLTLFTKFYRQTEVIYALTVLSGMHSRKGALDRKLNYMSESVKVRVSSPAVKPRCARNLSEGCNLDTWIILSRCSKLPSQNIFHLASLVGGLIKSRRSCIFINYANKAWKRVPDRKLCFAE